LFAVLKNEQRKEINRMDRMNRIKAMQKAARMKDE
jgi:hypothetical protein